jgi:hypothetical protein
MMFSSEMLLLASEYRLGSWAENQNLNLAISYRQGLYRHSGERRNPEITSYSLDAGACPGLDPGFAGMTGKCLTNRSI